MKKMVKIPHEDRAGFTCIAGGLICDKCKSETYEYIHTKDICDSDTPLYEKFGYQNFRMYISGHLYLNEIDLCPNCIKKTTALEMIEISKRRQEEVSNGVKKIFDELPPKMTCTVTVTCPSSEAKLPLKDENWVPSYPNEVPEVVTPIVYTGEPLPVKLFEDASKKDSDYVNFSKYLKTTNFVI